MLGNKREAKQRPQEVADYIQNKGWAHKLEGNNYKIETCIFCGNAKSNFEIHKDKGIYKTWCCAQNGGFYELKKHLGDEAFTVRDLDNEVPEAEKFTEIEGEKFTASANNFHARIYQRQVGLQYLKSRGFTDEAIKHFKLGCQKRNGEYWLTIPHWVGDQCVNIKYRSIPPADKQFRQEEKSQKVLFNHNALSGPADSIIITEGELKSVSLWQNGFHNTVSLTGGVEGIKPEWMDQLQRFEKIYLCLDADAPGQRAAEKLAMRLGPERTYNIVLQDAKDPDEWFFRKGHTPEEFQFLIDTAKLVDIKNIVSLNRALGLLQEEIETQDEDAYQGLLTQWDDVNALTKGFKPGELIVLSAPPKYGKTTWALDWTLYQTGLGNPGLFFCVEMNATRLARKCVANLRNVDNDMMDADDVAHARYEMRRRPLYLPDKVGRGIDPEGIFETITAAYRRYGLKFVVFDNIHFLVRSNNNLREKIGEVSQGFKLLAEELRIPIILIVHPRKLNKNKAMTADDIKETGSIHADADQLIFLHRNKQEVDADRDDDDPELHDKNVPLDPWTEIIVDSSRFSEGGKVKLYYDGAKSKFITKERRENQL